MNDFNTNPNDQYFTLIACVDQCAIDLDVSVSHYGQRLLSWGARGLVELNLDSAQQIKTILLDVSDTLTCTLPVDMVDWVKIAEPWHQYAITLCVNDDLTETPRTISDWNPTFNHAPEFLPNGVSTLNYGGWIFGLQGGRSLFSFGGGLPQTGQFKVISTPNGCKELLLDAGVRCSKIYLEYISTGFNPCGETMLSPYFYEYVRAYIHHQYAKFGKRIDKSEAEIERTGREVWHQEMKVRGRVNSVTPKDVLRISRRNYRLTNKI